MVHFEWNKKLKNVYDLHLARVFFDFCFSYFFVDAFLCMLAYEGFCCFYFTRRNWGLVWLRNCIQDCKFTDWTESIWRYHWCFTTFHNVSKLVCRTIATMFLNWQRKNFLRFKLAQENQFTFQSSLIVFHYIDEGTLESVTNSVKALFRPDFFVRVETKCQPSIFIHVLETILDTLSASAKKKQWIKRK